MDTSFDQTSPTLDFMLGNGINLPKPTDEDMARLLFATVVNLHEQGYLADIIGNHPVDASENHRLDWALRTEQNAHMSYLRKYRAKEIRSTVWNSPLEPWITLEENYLYLTCSPNHAAWVLLTESVGKPIVVSQLTAESMAKFFVDYRDWAQHIGLHILNKLYQLTIEQADRWEEKVRRMKKCTTALEDMNERVRSAFTEPRTSGTGFEG